MNYRKPSCSTSVFPWIISISNLHSLSSSPNLAGDVTQLQLPADMMDMNLRRTSSTGTPNLDRWFSFHLFYSFCRRTSFPSHILSFLLLFTRRSAGNVAKLILPKGMRGFLPMSRPKQVQELERAVMIIKPLKGVEFRQSEQGRIRFWSR